MIDMKQFQPDQLLEDIHGDYKRARRKATLSRLASALKRKPNALISWSEAKTRHAITCEGVHYDRLQQIPITAITGSVSRHDEFDRSFNPVSPATRERWESIDRAAISGATLPPVQLYKLGNTYFVKDGHHRISVARYRGTDFIDAEITEYLIDN